MKPHVNQYLNDILSDTRDNLYNAGDPASSANGDVQGAACDNNDEQQKHALDPGVNLNGRG